MLLSAASLVLQPFAQVGVLKYPPASVNGDQFLINFYSTFTAGDPYETGTPYNIGYDAHACHGVELPSGLLIAAGHSWETESRTANTSYWRSAFLIATKPTGEMAWHYLSSQPKTDEGVVAVTAMLADAGGDVIAAGFNKAVGNRYKRWLIRLDAATGALVWAKTFNTTAVEGPNSHSTFEAIATDIEGGVLLGGVTNNVGGQEFRFKSAGNIPQGDAFAWRISQEALLRPGGPTDADVTFSWTSHSWTSVKAIRTGGDGHGSAIALVHREALGGAEAGLVLLNFSTGTPIWGPIAYPQHTEGTDVAVAPDGSGYAITGHGSTVAKAKPSEYLGRLTRVTKAGAYLWTQNISSDPTSPDIIYNECWGVQPFYYGGAWIGWILSCGTGIESSDHCMDTRISATRQAWCTAGATTTFGIPRLPSVWSNMIAVTGDSQVASSPATLLGSSVTSYVRPGELPSTSGSSAAEFVAPCAAGGYYVTTDEVFGAGFLRLFGPPSATPTATTATTTAPPAAKTMSLFAKMAASALSGRKFGKPGSWGNVAPGGTPVDRSREFGTPESADPRQDEDEQREDRRQRRWLRREARSERRKERRSARRCARRGNCDETPQVLDARSALSDETVKTAEEA